MKSADNRDMMLRVIVSIFISIIFFVSCEPKGAFEPNNLITEQEDFDAEAEVARQSGPPLVDSFSFSNGPYKNGDTVSFTLTYQKKVLVTGFPRIQINLASGSVYANYVSGSTTTDLLFQYTVGPGDVDNDGITLVSPMEVNGGTIKDYADQAYDFTFTAPDTSALLVDAIAPTISSVTAPSNGTYITSGDLDFTVTISENAQISGTPKLVLDIGGTTKNAVYQSGSGTNTLIFRYTVESGLTDLDGIVVSANFDFGAGSITDIVGNDSNTGFATPNTSLINIDSVAPVLTSFQIEGGATYTQSTTGNITITASGADEMYIGTGCEAGGSWVAYNATPTETLAANSANTLYLKLRDSAGNATACMSANITHDNLVPNIVTGLSNTNNASDIISDLNSWTAASDNGPAGLSHYEYAVSTTANEANIVAGGGWFNIGTATSHQEAMTLAGGGTYYTLVKTIDLAGNESAIVASAAWNVTLSPEQLTNLATVNRGIDFIKVGWGIPDDNGTPITDYIIEYKDGGTGSWITINDGVNANTQYTHSSLVAETTYHYRVRAFNGTNYGAWSTTLITETLPNIDFFNGEFKAINIGGATANQIVSFADSNDIYKDGVLQTTLNKGDTYSIAATDFTVVEASEEFFIAGRRGSGGNTTKANMVWATSAWVGKEFYFSHNRSNPMKIKVYAFTDSTVNITKGGVPVSSQAISEENGHTFTISSYGSYEISSDGFIVAYSYANGNGTLYVDPQPLLPASTDIIGVPSSSGKLTSSADSNGYTVYHSSGQQVAGTANTGSTSSIGRYGTNSYYRESAARIIASSAIVTNSYADANGNCSAPFVPIALQKKRFGLNVQAEWTAFASTQGAVVTVTEPGQAPYDITLTGTSTYTKTPFKYYISVDLPAGTLFESTTPYQMWYEPKNDTNAANDDETVMFGWD